MSCAEPYHKPFVLRVSYLLEVRQLLVCVFGFTHMRVPTDRCAAACHRVLMAQWAPAAQVFARTARDAGHRAVAARQNDLLYRLQKFREDQLQARQACSAQHSSIDAKRLYCGMCASPEAQQARSRVQFCVWLVNSGSICLDHSSVHHTNKFPAINCIFLPAQFPEG